MGSAPRLLRACRAGGERRGAPRTGKGAALRAAAAAAGGRLGQRCGRQIAAGRSRGSGAGARARARPQPMRRAGGGVRMRERNK